MVITKKRNPKFITNKSGAIATRKRKKVNITTFKTKKNTQGIGNKLLTKRNRTNKIQKGNGLFTSSKKKNLLKQYENYINNTILNFYFGRLNKKNIKKEYKFSYQKKFIKSLNTKYRELMRKCIYKTLIILYKKDKYHKSSNIITSSNQNKRGQGYSLYKILNENVHNLVTDFFTTVFDKSESEYEKIENFNDEKIKEYIKKRKNNINKSKQIFYMESSLSVDRHFNHSDKKVIALYVNENNIHIINNVFTQIKFYIDYLTTNQKEKKEVIKIKNMLKQHFKYLCNNKNKIANFFVEYIKFRLS